MNNAVWDCAMGLLMALLSAWILKEYFGTFLEKKKKHWAYKILWGIFILWQVCSILRFNQKAQLYYAVSECPGGGACGI